jgi:hypothetical protein
MSAEEDLPQSPSEDVFASAHESEEDEPAGPANVSTPSTTTGGVGAEPPSREIAQAAAKDSTTDELLKRYLKLTTMVL